jgi:hypothetical protein
MDPIIANRPGTEKKTLLTRMLIASLLATMCMAGPFALQGICAAENADDPEEPEVIPPTQSDLHAKYPGIVIRDIKIAETDPDLVGKDVRRHWIFYQPNVKHRGVLLVDLPGTHGKASDKGEFDALAAHLGYHVLNLTYRTAIAAAIFRQSPDPNGYLKGRENIIYGTAPIHGLNVDKPNSIMNRLVKALQFLAKNYPQEGWGDFVHGDQPVWQKLAFTGVSQGGGHACLLGIQHPVERVIMFGAPKDFSLYFNKPAAWLSMKPATPITSFFCFNHRGDNHHGCSYPQQVENYKALRLLPRFPIVDVENERPPYRHTRLLTAHTPADIPKHNHGMVAGDLMFMPAWKYLLTEPCPN